MHEIVFPSKEPVNSLVTGLYRSLLRLPAFRGKGRIENLARRLFFQETRSPVIHGLLMELDPLEWSQISLLADGFLEPLTISCYARILRPGDTYVDVGAHVGFHTLMARRAIGPSGRVIAVEPQPYNCTKILANWRVNRFDNLTLHVAVAAAANDAVLLHDQVPTDKARLSLNSRSVNDLPLRFSVPMSRLDKLLDEDGVAHVQLLKIDVEGYEPEVIVGLGRRLECVDNIIAELLGLPDQPTARMKNLVDHLVQSGFRLQTVEGKLWSFADPLPENNLWAQRPTTNAE